MDENDIVKETEQNVKSNKENKQSDTKESVQDNGYKINNIKVFNEAFLRYEFKTN